MPITTADPTFNPMASTVTPITKQSAAEGGSTEPVTRGTINQFWILWYRHQVNPNGQFKIFEYKGSLRDAIVRAQKHCEIMSLKFLFIKPFIVDLTDEEIGKVESRRDGASAAR